MRKELARFGIEPRNQGASSGREWFGRGEPLLSRSPIDGRALAEVETADANDREQVLSRAVSAFEHWRDIPAPRRGDVVRKIGNAVRQEKEALGRLICLETGKLLVEACGEVQEMIDICDFAVGLSRNLQGRTLPSERLRHRLYEQWQPLGPMLVISAFNFPVAVPAWNAAIALVAGNTVVWKPSSKSPLTAIALTRIIHRVLAGDNLPEGIFNLLVGGRGEIGAALVADPRLPLVSATGSVAMGEAVATVVAARLGRCILELGGNNAIIVAPSADLELAERAILFGAVGTAGQRCTTTRRLIIHNSIYPELVKRLHRSYHQVRIGNPLEDGVLMGPLIDPEAVTAMQQALQLARDQGGQVIYGGDPLSGAAYPGGAYVSPCLVEVPGNLPIVCSETFAPILYLMRYHEREEAIALHNGVPQGLSSAIFTRDLREAEWFLSAGGSDCGIANVNIGTSGAEIGGAFGGEKQTGGGREAGSDAWKGYMRRQTVTINWGDELPLAQGIEFGGR